MIVFLDYITSSCTCIYYYLYINVFIKIYKFSNLFHNENFRFNINFDIYTETANDLLTVRFFMDHGSV